MEWAGDRSLPETMTTCELLAPAGNLEKLKIAIHYGADAVYFGGKEFSLRSRAGNLTREEIQEAIGYARRHKVKTYVTVNIFARNHDLTPIKDYLDFLSKVEPHAIIVSDPGVISLARKCAPNLPIHLSTQANTTNYESVHFWQKLGIRRVNLARELGLKEIKQIREKTSLELETFVHGAICISYSGRCMLSLYLAARDANRGNCAHPCRYAYQLQEEKRPGEFFPVEEDGRGLYIFNSKDMCLIRRIPELVASRVDSLKIEGRMKGIFYLATVVRTYRAALDEALGLKTTPFSIAKAERELSLISSRKYTENFIDGPPNEKDMLYEGPEVLQPYIPVAVVIKGGKMATVKMNHVLSPGDELEYMNKDLSETRIFVDAIYDAKTNKRLDKATGGELVRIRCKPEINFEPFALIRRKNLPAPVHQGD